MSADLRRELVSALESGSLEQLSAILALIHLLCVDPKTHEASPDFADRTGLASKNEIAKSTQS